MKKKYLLFVLLFIFSIEAYAQNAAPISVHEVDGRKEVVVPTTPEPKELPRGFFGKSFSIFETSIVKTARVSSAIVGKITDTTVYAVQKVTQPVFSPVFKALDVRRLSQKRQNSSRENA